MCLTDSGESGNRIHIFFFAQTFLLSFLASLFLSFLPHVRSPYYEQALC